MALSSLDDRAALIVIDLQTGTRNLPIVSPMEGVVSERGEADPLVPHQGVAGRSGHGCREAVRSNRNGCVGQYRTT